MPIFYVPEPKDLIATLGYGDDYIQDPIDPWIFHPKPKSRKKQESDNKPLDSDAKEPTQVS